MDVYLDVIVIWVVDGVRNEVEGTLLDSLGVTDDVPWEFEVWLNIIYQVKKTVFLTLSTLLHQHILHAFYCVALFKLRFFLILKLHIEIKINSIKFRLIRRQFKYLI